MKAPHLERHIRKGGKVVLLKKGTSDGKRKRSVRCRKAKLVMPLSQVLNQRHSNFRSLTVHTSYARSPTHLPSTNCCFPLYAERLIFHSCLLLNDPHNYKQLLATIRISVQAFALQRLTQIGLP